MPKKAVAADGWEEETDMNISGAKGMLVFLHAVSQELEIDPTAYAMEQKPRLWIVYPNAWIQSDDWIEEYKEILIFLARRYEIAIRGLIQGFEVGEIQIETDGEAIHFAKRAASGQDFTSLRDLCVCVEGMDSQTQTFLTEAVQAMTYRSPCVAVRQRWARVFRDPGLLVSKLEAYFSYVVLEEGGDEYNFLTALSIEQKKELWLQYLVEQFSPVEFAWLFDRYKEGGDEVPLGWEIALQLAMDEAKIQVRRQGEGFSVRSREGRPVPYDYGSTMAAERVFGKILFPAPPARR